MPFVDKTQWELDKQQRIAESVWAGKQKVMKAIADYYQIYDESIETIYVANHAFPRKVVMTAIGQIVFIGSSDMGSNPPTPLIRLALHILVRPLIENGTLKESSIRFIIPN